MILQWLTRFDKTNDISWNFSGITLGFSEVLKYFVDFQFCLLYFQKMTAKFWFLSNRFKISKFRIFWWQTNVNITVTYWKEDSVWYEWLVYNSFLFLNPQNKKFIKIKLCLSVNGNAQQVWQFDSLTVRTFL